MRWSCQVVPIGWVQLVWYVLLVHVNGRDNYHYEEAMPGDQPRDHEERKRRVRVHLLDIDITHHLGQLHNAF